MNGNQMRIPMFELFRNTLAEMLKGIFGSACWDDSAEETAERIIRYWNEYKPMQDPPFAITTFPADVNQMIMVKDIEFSSLCSHHLLPFYGKAHVGYIPTSRMIGLSKIPRVVDHFATRPCTQEALTANIAEFLKRELIAMGVAVIVQARHTCMACRGVRKHNGLMITSEMRGVFLTAGEARAEFLSMIHGGDV